MILCLGGAVAAGFFGIAYFQIHPELAVTVNQNSETVFMELTKILFNPWIAGIVLAAILAIVMSTLSCQLLVCSSTLTEDFIKPLFVKMLHKRTGLGRSFNGFTNCNLSNCLASNPESQVLGLVAYAWAGFGAAFGPLILLSLFWKRMNLAGALAGMIVGAVVVILWKNIPVFADTKIYEIIPGFISAMIAIIVFSLITRAPEQDVIDRFEEADRAYKDVS